MEQAVLMVSDTHVGKATVSYNLTVCRERFERLGNKVVHLLKEHQPSVHKVNIFMLGDIVDGEEVYPNQAHFLDHIDLKTLERLSPMMEGWLGTMSANALLQVYLAAQLVADHLIKPLVSNGLDVTVYCVAGNHGISSQRTHPSTNFDAFSYLLLAEAIKPIPVKASPSPYMTVEVCGHRFLLYHGTGIKIYQRIPLYGVMTKSVNWLAYKQFGHFDAVCMGHFHVACYFPVCPIIFLNGTMVTDDLYPVEKMGVSGVNYFLLFGVTEKHLPSFIYPINLVKE